VNGSYGFTPFRNSNSGQCSTIKGLILYDNHDNAEHPGEFPSHTANAEPRAERQETENFHPDSRKDYPYPVIRNLYHIQFKAQTLVFLSSPEPEAYSDPDE
jgi:hypothetical protein